MLKKIVSYLSLTLLVSSPSAWAQALPFHCAKASVGQGYAVDQAEKKDGTIAIVTGSESGTYAALGNDIARLANEHDAPFHLCVKPSKGSLDNVLRMSSRENAGLGIAQSDVIHHIINNNINLGGRGAKELRLIAPLYNEEVHILARKNYKSIHDLKGKKVNVGPQKGGSWVTALALFQALYSNGKGIPDYRYLPHREALNSVVNGEVDAMVFVSGKPVQLFSELEMLDPSLRESVHFVSISSSDMQGLPYVAAEIGPEDYSWLSNTIETVAVKSQLIAYDFSRLSRSYHTLRCEQFTHLGSLLRDHIKTLQSSGNGWHPKWKQVDLTARVEGWERDLCAWNSISLVAGFPNGTYFSIGQDIASMAKPSIFMEVKTSEGSVDNVRRLRSESGENAAISITQSDVLAQLKRSPKSSDRTLADSLRLITPLYNEEIHLLATKDIKSIRDLAGKKISAGREKSGSYMTAQLITQHLEQSPDMVFLSKQDAFQQLKNGEIQAMLFVGGKPMRFFKEKLERRYNNFPESFANIHLVPITPEDLPETLSYIESDLSNADYQWIESDQPIPTMAVKSLLVSKDFSSKKNVYYRNRCQQIQGIYQALKSNINQLKSDALLPSDDPNKKHGKWQEVALGAPLDPWVLDACAHSQTSQPANTRPVTPDVRPCDYYLSPAYKAKHAMSWSKQYSACINDQ